MNIGIIGLGLIGGSLALDLTALGHHVWGISRRESTCRQAVMIGAVTAAYHNIQQVPSLEQTQAIFLCTPIGYIIPTLAAIAPILSPQTIVTDVGSVKTPIVTAAAKLWQHFVGGHPMAGTEAQGISAAQRYLFQERPCVVIGEPDHADSQVVADLWRSVGMVVHYGDPVSHDQAVAWISHLPVIVSAALLIACAQEATPAIGKLAQALASSGFRDTSRVGGGNPELGQWMAAANQEALLKAIGHYQEALATLKRSIEDQEWQGLYAELDNAHHLRKNYPACHQ